MGNSNPQELNSIIVKKQPNTWIIVEDCGLYEIWENKVTQKRYQAYPIDSQITKDSRQLEKYIFRKNNQLNLVGAEFIVVEDDTFLCTAPRNAYVLIENIVKRLESMHNLLTFEEGLSVLSSASTGYNTLNSFYGPLQPTDEMICFNQHGKTKVWLNENLSKNQPSLNTRSITDVRNPRSENHFQIVESRSKQCTAKLFSLVQKAVHNGYPFEFKQKLFSQDVSSYFGASNFVEGYCQQHNIKIPSYISLFKFQPEGSSQSIMSSTPIIPIHKPMLAQSNVKDVIFYKPHPALANIAQSKQPVMKYQAVSSHNIIPLQRNSSQHIQSHSSIPYKLVSSGYVHSNTNIIAPPSQFVTKERISQRSSGEISKPISPVYNLQGFIVPQVQFNRKTIVKSPPRIPAAHPTPVIEFRQIIRSSQAKSNSNRQKPKEGQMPQIIINPAPFSQKIIASSIPQQKLSVLQVKSVEEYSIKSQAQQQSQIQIQHRQTEIQSKLEEYKQEAEQYQKIDQKQQQLSPEKEMPMNERLNLAIDQTVFQQKVDPNKLILQSQIDNRQEKEESYDQMESLKYTQSQKYEKQIQDHRSMLQELLANNRVESQYEQYRQLSKNSVLNPSQKEKFNKQTLKTQMSIFFQGNSSEVKTYKQQIDPKIIESERQSKQNDEHQMYSSREDGHVQEQEQENENENEIQKWEQRIMQMSEKKNHKRQSNQIIKNKESPHKKEASPKLPGKKSFQEHKLHQIEQNQQIQDYIRTKFRDYLSKDKPVPATKAEILRPQIAESYEIKQVRFKEPELQPQEQSPPKRKAKGEKREKLDSYESDKQSKNAKNSISVKFKQIQAQERSQQYHSKDNSSQNIENEGYIRSNFKKKSNKITDNFNIDEKYKKYVLNAKPIKKYQTNYNRSSATITSKDVSLMYQQETLEPKRNRVANQILPSQLIVRESQGQIRRNSPKSNTRTDQKGQHRRRQERREQNRFGDRLTYQRLRSYLWE